MSLPGPVEASDGSLLVPDEPLSGVVFAEVTGAEVDVVDAVGHVVVLVVVDVGAVVDVVVDVEVDVVVDDVDEVVVDVGVVVDVVVVDVGAVEVVVEDDDVVVVEVVEVGVVVDVVVVVGAVEVVVDVAEDGQFATVVEVVVEDVVVDDVVVPVFPVREALATSAGDWPESDAPALLAPAGCASATAAPHRVNVRSAGPQHVRNLMESPPIARPPTLARESPFLLWGA